MYIVDVEPLGFSCVYFLDLSNDNSSYKLILVQFFECV